MNKRILCLLVMLGFGMQANATVISFSPSDNEVGIGNSVSVDLVISELGADILTGFDLDVLYDDTLLAFDSFEFGTDCGGFSCLDVLGLGSLQEATDWGFGVVEVFELSFDLDADLMAFQPDAFVLGTFTFTGLDFGTSALDIFIWELAGEYVFDPDLGFDVPKALDATVEGGQIEVPEPGTWLLLMSGLLGLRMMGRKKVVRA
jgi:hypothetical protein